MSGESERHSNRFVLIVVGLILYLSFSGGTNAPEVKPSPVPAPDISTGFFSDVRVKLDPNSMATLCEFIRTGKLSKDRIGIDMTKVDSIRCLPNRLVFEPPIELSYNGPGPLKAGTVVREIGIQADGTILVDVVNSPIDLVLE
jgi:hypothetical protein